MSSTAEHGKYRFRAVTGRKETLGLGGLPSEDEQLSRYFVGRLTLHDGTALEEADLAAWTSCFPLWTQILQAVSDEQTREADSDTQAESFDLKRDQERWAERTTQVAAFFLGVLNGQPELPSIPVAAIKDTQEDSAVAEALEEEIVGGQAMSNESGRGLFRFSSKASNDGMSESSRLPRDKNFVQTVDIKILRDQELTKLLMAPSEDVFSCTVANLIGVSVVEGSRDPSVKEFVAALLQGLARQMTTAS